LEKFMRKLAAALAVVALISSATTIAEARGGRTSAKDCDAGSDDPDCPDAPKSSQSNSAQSAPRK
jgi:hypothetical protein